MNSTQLWFRVVLASSCNILSGRLYWPKPQHPWFKTTKHTRKEEPLNKIPTLESSDMLQKWNLIERWSILSVLVRYSLRFPLAHWCYSDKTESISSMLIPITTPKEKKRLSHPPFHTIIEDTIRHNIAQMTSTSKAYIPCLLATMIKWCHIAWDRHQHRDGGR